MHKFSSRLIEFCKQTLSFDEQVSYGYQSLSVCILDCVYSLRAQYYSTTVPVVERYAARYMSGNRFAKGDTVSRLIANIEKSGGAELFAKNVLENRQVSGHVLKSEVCLQLARYLRYLHIETMEDFQKFEAPELLEVVVRSVKGMGDAGVNYLFMLTGDPNRCKPDVHIHHFIKDACGNDVSNDECQVLLTDVVEELRGYYPCLTVAMLDGIIWRKYQALRA
jgi:hypothetical protein